MTLIFLFLGVLQKIFLDTTRLLAEKTNNLLEELWNYIENGKLIQSAILLMAAQEQIRRGCSSKINGSSKKDGFDVINKRILWLSFALRWEKGSNEMAEKLLKERRALIDCTGLLVDVISHTGQRLSSYIQAHSEVLIFGCIVAMVPQILRCLLLNILIFVFCCCYLCCFKKKPCPNFSKKNANNS
jgi:hypothetical protein